MTEHTKGPWHIHPDINHETVVNNSVGQFIADAGGSHYLSRDVQEANARLIAAAPCLLEVVELYLELSPDQPPNLSKLARTAVAKATGQPQPATNEP